MARFTPLLFMMVIDVSTHAAQGGLVSVTALIGTIAQFHCSGSGAVLLWKVDGLPSNLQAIKNRGITKDTEVSSGTVQSNLTVPATSVNNGTTVQCLVGSSFVSLSVVGNSTLTILPGIGPVVNVQFTSSFSAVLWDPPATAAVLNGLSYRVIVINNDTVVVNGTTANTNYPLPNGLNETCQYYTANVTAFSSQHHGESVVIGQRVPGGYLKIENVSPEVVLAINETYLAITFAVNIKQPGAT